jgi:hypothetical protein
MITHCILAARAHGIEILDGPYSDFSNTDGFALECAQARDLGFDGKTLIHPGQIVACNAIFTPPAEEVAHARKIIAAFERPENASRGCDPARRPDGGATARRYGQAHHRDCGRDRGDGELNPPRPDARRDVEINQIAPWPRHRGCRQPAAGCHGLSVKCEAR